MCVVALFQQAIGSELGCILLIFTGQSEYDFQRLFFDQERAREMVEAAQVYR